MKKSLRKYCTGCGLCTSLTGIPLTETGTGFVRVADLKDETINHICETICPASGKHIKYLSTSPWGEYNGKYAAFAKDEVIRFKAASGGVTTAIASFLIDKGFVDGVIQVGKSEDPFATCVYCNTTKEEVINCSGSRYIVASPLSTIFQVIEKGGKYAFIGRPCDVLALRQYMHINPSVENSIYIMLSFFCAGSPSITASKKLVSRLNVSEKECKEIRYRGEGWPGKTTVTDKNGHKTSMEYSDSWNNILGRDVMPICKFCADGVGEFADISSGDLWYLSDEKTPSFNEQPGRNITFTRTKIGYDVMQMAVIDGYISISDYKDDDLAYVQPYHANRKRLLLPKILAMKTMMQICPDYKIHDLIRLTKGIKFTKMTKTFLGTIKRILKTTI